jgi:hypothetical protein
MRVFLLGLDVRLVTFSKGGESEAFPGTSRACFEARGHLVARPMGAL